MHLSTTKTERLQRARSALEGLSVADAFGGFFEFNHRVLKRYVEGRLLPPAPWHYTDDTNMALSIYEVLRLHGEIDQDALAQSFATHFDRLRGYGAGARRLVTRIGEGEDWHTVAKAMFGGTGSYGNGGAMRVAPLGAYFADDLTLAAEQAAMSAEITHAHTEGVAGAIAVAVAAGISCRWAADNVEGSTAEFIDLVLPFVPESEVRSKIIRARDVQTQTVQHVADMLGNGSAVSAQDTVPFVLWSAASHLDDYEMAFWQTASAGGDVDTTCAMVGGIVSCYTGVTAIPKAWREMRESLPTWALGDD